MGKIASFFLGFAVLLSHAGATASQTGIAWHSAFETARNQAGQARRPMLVYLWAPWCPACSENERDVLSQPRVAALVHAAFVPVKVNTDQSPELARHYGVRTLPAFVVLMPDGTPLDRIEGRMAAEQLTDRLGRFAAPAGAAAPSTPPVSPPPTPPHYSTHGASGMQPAVPAENPPLGLDGYCAVSLCDDLLANRRDRWVLGNKAHGVIHRGRTYLFVDAEKAARFFQDPDRYAPVLSGQDVVLAVEKGQAVPGHRRHGAYFGGRVYLFASEETVQRFENNPNHYADAAMRLASRSVLPR